VNAVGDLFVVGVCNAGPKGRPATRDIQYDRVMETASPTNEASSALTGRDLYIPSPRSELLQRFKQTLSDLMEARQEDVATEKPATSCLAHSLSLMQAYESTTLTERSQSSSTAATASVYAKKPLLPIRSYYTLHPGYDMIPPDVSPPSDEPVIDSIIKNRDRRLRLEVRNGRSYEVRMLYFPKQDLGAQSLRCKMYIWDFVFFDAATVSQKLRYHSLSYRWLSDGRKKVLDIDGAHIAINADLDQALRAILQSDSLDSAGAIIWVDAICIDQSNAFERQTSVKLMSMIYQRCEACLIWLGDADDTSEQAMALLDELSGEMKDKEAVIARIKNWSVASSSPERRSEQHQAILSLLSRPYWERLWIVQEVIFSPNNKHIFCGNQRLSWSAVATLLVFYPVFGMDLELSRLLQSRCAKAYELVQLSFWNPGRKLEIIEALLLSQGRKASDVRDCIFAVHLMMQTLMIDVDYSTSNPGIWIMTEAAIEMTIQEKDYPLNLLSMAGPAAKSSPEELLKYICALSVMARFEEHNDSPLDDDGILLGLKAFGFDTDHISELYMRGLAGGTDEELLRALEIYRLMVKKDLPSWVPNWDISRPSNGHILYYTEFGGLKKRSFRVSPPIGMTAMSGEGDIGRGETVVRSYFVDVVAGVIDLGGKNAWSQAWSQWEQYLSQVLDSAQNLGAGRKDAFMRAIFFATRKDEQNIFDMKGTLQHDITRALIIGQGLEAEEIGEAWVHKYYEAWGKLVALVEAEDLLGKLTQQDVRRLLSKTKAHIDVLEAHHSIFFTKAGNIGVGNRQTQVGDEVTLILGCEVPIMLREAEDRSESISTGAVEMPTYRVGGECCE
jgi:hypothetical protein